MCSAIMSLDKTIIADRKDEEKAFSEKIFLKLEMLYILYKPTQELKNVTTEDMFAKPNTKAFLHVMHYLFNILDPTEFKKRFYWPAFDKKSEALFRSAAVQYLNFLNESYGLNWGEVKNFVLLMPGGMKFMCLLSHIIDFVVHEESKKSRAYINEDLPSKLRFVGEITSRILNEHQHFLDKAQEKKFTFEKREKNIKEKIEKIQSYLIEASKQAKISVPKLEEDVFVHTFIIDNGCNLKTDIIAKINDLVSINDPIEALDQLLQNIQNDKQDFSCDKTELMSSFNSVQREFSDDYLNSIMYSESQINLESLLNAFNCTFSSFEKALSKHSYKSDLAAAYERDEIGKLKEEAVQLEQSILRFENSVINKKALENNAGKCNKENIKFNLISTPPIRFGSYEINSIKPRLPLMNDYTNNENSFSLSNQTTVCVPKSAKKYETVISGNHKSKLIDPVTLLNTLTKKNRYDNTRCAKENLTSLATKWKEKESMLKNESRSPSKSLSHTVVCRRQESETLFCDSPSATLCKLDETFKLDNSFSSCLNEAQKKFIAEKLVEKMSTGSPSSVIYQKKTTDSVILVHDSFQAYDFQKVNKSPSGRIDALVKVEEDMPSKMLFNDDLTLCATNDIQPPKQKILEETTAGGNFKHSPSTSHGEGYGLDFSRNIYENINFKQAESTFDKLNKSPTGRIDALVRVEESVPPKIILNDSLTLLGTPDIESHKKEALGTGISARNGLPHTPHLQTRYKIQDGGTNSIGFGKKNHKNLNFDDGDSIFNISDTILKDVDI